VYDNISTQPALSAIVVFPDSYDTVRHIVSYLKAQTVANQLEIVFVGPSDKRDMIPESELGDFHSWQLVAVDEVKSLGTAYVDGIRQSHAPIIALTHDHSFSDEKWAELLISAHGKSWAAVGPCMGNGNPDNVVSWADFYLCYGEWADPIASGPVRSLPSHHSSYKRDILLSLGSQLYTLMEDEYFLFRHLSERGHEFFLETKIRNDHVNLNSMSSWIPSRFYKGRQFAATWTCMQSWPKRLLFSMASPLLPLVRLWRVQNRIRRSQSCGFLMRLLPILTMGLFAEWLGQKLGFLAGVGDSNEKVEKFEFNRIRYAGPIVT
jgi:hypothetical protein